MTAPATRSLHPKAALPVTLLGLLALAAPVVVRGQTADACSSTDTPAGARSLGYVHRVLCVAPTMADISVTGTAASPLYSGKWYDKNPTPLTMFSTNGQLLGLDNGAQLMTESRRSLPGTLPLLLGSSGFYVEFAERLSDNDPDHFPAVWLMPQEHNVGRSDHQSGDPAGYERWMELDVDEGGFNTGHHGALINWYGIYPQYSKQIEANDPPSTFGMDRTQEHIFGLSYDPAGKKVTWWVDGVSVGTASSDGLPPIVNDYHYYLIMYNQSHGLNHPYKMYIRYLSAWSVGVVPNPPTGVRTGTGN
jgi:hypothetical protein